MDILNQITMIFFYTKQQYGVSETRRKLRRLYLNLQTNDTLLASPPYLSMGRGACRRGAAPPFGSLPGSSSPAYRNFADVMSRAVHTRIAGLLQVTSSLFE